MTTRRKMFIALGADALAAPLLHSANKIKSGALDSCSIKIPYSILVRSYKVIK